MLKQKLITLRVIFELPFKKLCSKATFTVRLFYKSLILKNEKILDRIRDLRRTIPNPNQPY